MKRERKLVQFMSLLYGVSLFMEDVEITGNDCRGIYIYDKKLKLSGTSVINGNYARESDGRAILFDCSASGTSFVRFDTTSLTTLSIINNTADGYGGGIAIRNCGGKVCFFGSEFVDEVTITMKHNLATKGGDAIYGG